MKSNKEIIAEYVVKMDSMDTGDVESAHAEADDALIKVLEDLGWADLSSAWQRVELRCKGFWYA
jgi:hypothetical protein